MDKDKVIFRDDVIVKPFSLVADGIHFVMYSASGKLYTSELVASYENYTHEKCKSCSLMFMKNSYCPHCAHKKEIEDWQKMPAKEFSGQWPLFSISASEYFFKEEILVDYIIVNEVSIDSLMLTDCIEDHPKALEMDHFNDENYEEFLNPELESLIDEFNEKAKNIVLGYLPGKNRIVFSDDFNDYVDAAVACNNDYDLGN